MESVDKTTWAMLNDMFHSLLGLKESPGAHGTPSPSKAGSCSGASTVGDSADSLHETMELIIDVDADGYPMPASQAKPDMIDDGEDPEGDMKDKGTVRDATPMPVRDKVEHAIWKSSINIASKAF